MPAPSWSGPDPARITGWTLVQAGQAVGRLFWQQFGERGLTPIEFGVLIQLDRAAGMSNAEIARIVLVTPQAMSSVLAGLERDGLVERDHTPGRGRRHPARLTEAGRRRLQECVQAVEHVEAALGLAPDRAARLREDLHQLLATLRGA